MSDLLRPLKVYVVSELEPRLEGILAMYVQTYPAYETALAIIYQMAHISSRSHASGIAYNGPVN
jgi:hypothetical protein